MPRACASKPVSPNSGRKSHYSFGLFGGKDMGRLLVFRLGSNIHSKFHLGVGSARGGLLLTGMEFL